VEQQVAQLKNGACLLLENIRFYAEETNNDETFARTLAQFGEVYVNDAFGAAHRAHASTEGVTHFIPIRAAGFLMQKELDYLAGAVSDPKRPFVVILGGAKVSDKIAVTQRLIEIADTLIIGGGMAYTFLKSQGGNIGHSLLDEENLSFAAEMINKAKTENKSLLLPIDHVIAEKFDPEDTRITSQVPDGWMGLDIGPETRDQFVEAIEQAGTILWNGPMGVFENAAFSGGTAQVGQAVAQATDHGAVSIIGGGDTAAAVNLLGLKSRMSHISTGGGASLELLEGRDLPGVKALN
jgi:phosphoglycerate kinase